MVLEHARIIVTAQYFQANKNIVKKVFTPAVTEAELAAVFKQMQCEWIYPQAIACMFRRKQKEGNATITWNEFER